jgi:hypothetical protein
VVSLSLSHRLYESNSLLVLVGNSPLESMSPPGGDSAMVMMSTSTPSRDERLRAVLDRFVSNYRGTGKPISQLKDIFSYGPSFGKQTSELRRL